MKLKFIYSIALTLLSLVSIGQEVPRKIIVEHFTNSLCGTCASRNPGFFNNYANENTGNMIHLAIHPSAPYSACIFNQHDKNGNDDRVKYYGVFGSTPRLIINGSAVSTSMSYNGAGIFTPYVGQTSPISVKLDQQKFGSDSIRVRVVVKTVASHSLGNQNLYVVLAEDTVFYNAPNGEDEHYDVMRKPLFGNSGMSVTVPTTIGDSLVYTTTVAAHADWDFARIYALAILQNESDKSVTQSEALAPSVNGNVILGLSNIAQSNSYNVYPNPVINQLKITSNTIGESTYKLISISGSEMLTGNFNTQTTVSTTAIPKGIYFLVIDSTDGIFTQKIIKSGF
jgi:hypothetical protein